MTIHKLLKIEINFIIGIHKKMYIGHHEKMSSFLSVSTTNTLIMLSVSLFLALLIPTLFMWFFMQEKVVRVGVYVGRFQPLTNAHLASIIHFLSKFDEMIILIGSHGLPEYNEDNGKPVSPKNPYNTAIRCQMIMEAVSDYVYENNISSAVLEKLHIRGIHDSNHKHGYAPDKCNFSAWNSGFNNIVCKVLESKYNTEYFETSDSFDSHFDVFLCGSGKDKATQDYLQKIRLGWDGSDGAPAVVRVNYDGNPYLIEYLIDPICMGDSSQTVDATTIRSLITRINAGEHDQMTELEKWVPEATIRVLLEHKKLIKIK